MRNDLEKNRIIERQAPNLAKGEVDKSKGVVDPSMETLALNSHEMNEVRSGETTIKECRVLSGSLFTFAGAQSISGTDSDAQTVHQKSSNSDAPSENNDKIPQYYFYSILYNPYYC